MRFPFHFIPLLMSGISVYAEAAEQAAPASAGSLLRVLLGMVAVLALMAGAVWLLRRYGVTNAVSSGAVKLVGGLSVGGRERVLVLEVADQWIVVGVAPGRVSALSTMPKQEAATLPQSMPMTKSFSSWLQQTIEKRNAR
jgi:flagellar protein FliO/FliZ